MGLNYEGFFEYWEVAVAKNLINDFKIKWELLDKEEFDDLLQECLTHWYFARDRFDPNEDASERSFMSRVVWNKLGNIFEKINTNKREMIYRCVSLDAPAGSYEGAPALFEKIAADADESQDIFLQMDLPKAIEKLTPTQKKLCRLLGEEGFTVKEASEYLKTPRSTVYEEIKRIRAIFRNEKLERFLK